MDYDVSLGDVVNESFSQYAGAVIQSRALVDVRDCVKPSARQIYYSLYQDGFTSDKPFKKTLKAIGSAFKYYIHGDASCEGIIMRSGQPFSMRYPLMEVEGSYGNQTETGNWAASRYTASRLSSLANYLIQETDKCSIEEWVDNYDDTAQYPRVLSSLGFYNIVNGSFGIAVGLASSIPQFNLKEVNQALVDLLKNPDIEEEQIICLPDFATGGIIVNKNEVVESLKKGTGKAVIIQAKVQYDSKENCLIVTELPYGVYTNTICGELEKIAQKDDNFGIIRINDLTGEQVCIKLYLARNTSPQEMIDYLYKNTSLQSSYSINMTMLENGRFPKIYGWKAALQAHLTHEEQVYTRVYEHERQELKHRLKIVLGIITAIERIDQVIQTIKTAESTSSANNALQILLGIDQEQAKAILDMRLARLTKLDIKELMAKRDEYTARVEEIEAILADVNLLHGKMITRFQEVAKEFGDERRTQVVNKEIQKKSPKEKQKELPHSVIICLDKNGYVKSVPVAKFRTSPNNIREEKVENNELIVFYSSLGRAFRVKASTFKECLNSDKGTALGTILDFQPQERIVIFTTPRCENSVIITTSDGYSKRVKSSDMNGATQNLKGMPIVKLHDAAEVVSVQCCEDYECLALTTTKKQLLLNIDDIPILTKASPGRKAMKLAAGDRIESARLTTKGNKSCGKMGSVGKNIS